MLQRLLRGPGRKRMYRPIVAGVFGIILAVVAISIGLGAHGGPGPTSSTAAASRTPLGCTKAPGAIHNDLDCAHHALITRVCHTHARSWPAGRARGFGLVPVPLFMEFDDRSGTPRASIVYQLDYSSRVVQLTGVEMNCYDGSGSIHMNAAEWARLLDAGTEADLPRTLR